MFYKFRGPYFFRFFSFARRYAYADGLVKERHSTREKNLIAKCPDAPIRRKMLIFPWNLVPISLRFVGCEQ